MTNPGGGRPPASRAQTPRSVPRPADSSSVDEFLHLLARAIQQFHTYPPTSQMCVNAIDACQRALVTLDGREQIVFRVMPRELIVDENPMGAGTVVEQELARRLHSAAIAQVTIERAASSRELARFCFDLLQCDLRNGLQLSLIDLLEEHGVGRIALRAAHRPQVLEVRAPSEPVAELIQHQRALRAEQLAAGGPIDHLYPPDKGWVRVDPTARFEQVSLVDLALLAQDPTTLAGMLLRLTEDDIAVGDGGEDALSRKFSDVAKLFAALDPRISRIMFGKLARAVLDLQPEQRQSLLKKTILPGLLDGKIDGNVLKDFPDVDLAESLCLLLDLETAAPEVVTTALERLDLTPERHASLLPLVQQRVDDRAGTKATDSGLDAHARKLMRIDRDKARSFAEFAAFDLALDDATRTTLVSITDAIGATDVLIVQLDCLIKLVRLEPNPELVQRFLLRAAQFVEQLERQERWPEIAAWLARQRELAAGFREARPDVAETITASLAAYCTVARATRLVELAGKDAIGRGAADAIVDALGPDVGPALLEALRTQAPETKDSGRAAVQLLCDHAKLVAPALVAALEKPTDDVVNRAIARVLGFAGAGHEPALGTLLASRDEQTVREAFRSLAKIGTPRAAALVAAEVSRSRGWVGGAAEQTLWHFPRNESDRQVRELLAHRDFVVKHPQVAGRLLERAAQNGAAHLAPILQALVPLRYRFWNPALVRVGRQAKTLLVANAT
jgi:HEAT repeats